MFYQEFQGLSLSKLGMGCMRLPTRDGAIDEREAQTVIERVYEYGVNYFDTAYMYHDGESERFLGRALSRYPRESYYLADKMTIHPILAGTKTVSDIFEEQLARCNTPYFDFYLLHNVNESTIRGFTDEQFGVLPYLLEQKRRGRIRHFGFSNHGRAETTARMLDHGAGCFEFVQMQLNYLDWDMQNAKSVYETIRARRLPVWVMEPCRGGRLAALSEDAAAPLRAARPDRSIASWAFRWLMGLDGVGVILSGMTHPEQAEDNIATFAVPDPLNDREQEALAEALGALNSLGVPCTGCRYCDGCPMELDIPEIIRLYNEQTIAGGRGPLMKLTRLPDGRGPAACIGCGACREKCPQHIDIPTAMAHLTEALAALRQER